MVPFVAATALVGVAKLTEVIALVLTLAAFAIVGRHTLFDQQVLQIFCALCNTIMAGAHGVLMPGGAIMPCGALNTRHFRLAFASSGLVGQGGVLELLSRDVKVRAHMFEVIARVGLSDACWRWVSNLAKPHYHACATLSCAHQRVGKTVVSCRSGLCW